MASERRFQEKVRFPFNILEDHMYIYEQNIFLFSYIHTKQNL